MMSAAAERQAQLTDMVGAMLPTCRAPPRAYAHAHMPTRICPRAYAHAPTVCPRAYARAHIRGRAHWIPRGVRARVQVTLKLSTAHVVSARTMQRSLDEMARLCAEEVRCACACFMCMCMRMEPTSRDATPLRRGSESARGAACMRRAERTRTRWLALRTTRIADCSNRWLLTLWSADCASLFADGLHRRRFDR